MRRVVPVGKCSSGLTRLVDFGSRTFVCGVLNITPDRLYTTSNEEDSCEKKLCIDVNEI